MGAYHPQWNFLKCQKELLASEFKNHGTLKVHSPAAKSLSFCHEEKVKVICLHTQTNA